jgi:hypothetical protein
MATRENYYLLKSLLRLLGVVFFVSVISSCKTNTKEFDTFSESDFSETLELKWSVLKLDQMLMRPINIHVYGDFLFLQNLGPSYFFETYDLKTNKRINECINRGKGPGEMIAPSIINIKNDRIRIYDRGKASLLEYELEDFISSHTPEVSKTVKLNAIYLHACISEDTFIASSLETPDNRFDFFDLDGKFLYSNGK